MVGLQGAIWGCKGQFGAARGLGSPLAGPKAGWVLLKVALQMYTMHLSSTPLQPWLASVPAVRDKARRRAACTG